MTFSGKQSSPYAEDQIGGKFRPLQVAKVLTIDEIFRRCGVEVCHFPKLDCEGAEYEILLNASEGTLRSIRRISMEYHVGLNDHTPEELARFLERRDFHVEWTPLLDNEGGYLYAARKS